MKKILMKSMIFGAAFIIICGVLSAKEVKTLTVANVNASSFEGIEFYNKANSIKAVDNNTKTYWTSSYKDNQWLEIELAKPIVLENIKINWGAAYPERYQVLVAEEPDTWTMVYEKKAKKNAARDIINLVYKLKAKYIKINCLKQATEFGNSIIDVQLNGMPLSITGELPAKEVRVLPVVNVTASSAQPNSLSAAKATDNDFKTRWSSSYRDDQWLEIELAKPIVLENIEIFWEGAYAQKYQILTAEKPGEWTTVYGMNAKKNADKDYIKLASKSRAKYIKIRCIKRATKYGNSIFEIRLNGKSLSAVEPLFAKELTVANVKASSFVGDESFIKANSVKAVDNNLKTHWSSSYKDNQWLEIELTEVIDLENIDINWGVGYARVYQILVAEKAGKWISVYKTNAKKNADKDSIKLIDKTKAKYIKIKCIKRATQLGTSIYELRLNGMPLSAKK
jgi:hypothetical protein